jgi:hypothetical protein
MQHTVSATYDRGLYTYFLDGTEFIRTMSRFTHATIYTRQGDGKDTGESVWVFPTSTNRRSRRRTIERLGAEFWGVVTISGIFPN